MKKLLLITLFFAACAAPNLLDEDGDQIATEVTITQDRSSLDGTLEPDAVLDTSSEGSTPANEIDDTDWTDDTLEAAVLTVTGQKKWKKGKTDKTITLTNTEVKRITSTFNITAGGYYKLKIKSSTGYMFSSKTASASGADVTVPPTYSGSKSACATYEEFTTTYTRTEFEFEQQVQGTKKVWVQTGQTRVIQNSKPAKVKVKRKTAWTFC